MAGVTVTTVYSSTVDGHINSSNVVYLTARAGSGLVTNTAGVTFTTGQTLPAGISNCFEGFVSFDTSPIPDAEPITAATLSLWATTKVVASSDFTLEARSSNWGASLDTGDWVAGASLSALTLLASIATTAVTTGQYNDLTENGTNLRTAIDVTGTTWILLDSDRHVAGNVPTGGEQVTCSSADEAGTTQDPKLVVTSTSSFNDSGMTSMALVGVGH